MGHEEKMAQDLLLLQVHTTHTSLMYLRILLRCFSFILTRLREEYLLRGGGGVLLGNRREEEEGEQVVQHLVHRLLLQSCSIRTAHVSIRQRLLHLLLQSFWRGNGS